MFAFANAKNNFDPSAPVRAPYKPATELSPRRKILAML